MVKTENNKIRLNLNDLKMLGKWEKRLTLKKLLKETK